MQFLDDNPRDSRSGLFGLRGPQLVSSNSPEIKAIADEVVLERSFKNPNFFEILVDRYQDGFLRTAYRVVHSRENAEDIVQETFVKVYKNGRKYKKVPGATFKSWAYRILMNTAFTHYRKLKRREVSLDEFFDVILYENTNQKTENPHKRLEQRDEVERALGNIPAELAELIRLHYFDGFSYDDISNQKNIPVSTLKMRLYRARKIVKKYL